MLEHQHFILLPILTEPVLYLLVGLFRYLQDAAFGLSFCCLQGYQVALAEAYLTEISPAPLLLFGHNLLAEHVARNTELYLPPINLLQLDLAPQHYQQVGLGLVLVINYRVLLKLLDFPLL